MVLCFNTTSVEEKFSLSLVLHLKDLGSVILMTLSPKMNLSAQIFHLEYFGYFFKTNRSVFFSRNKKIRTFVSCCKNISVNFFFLFRFQGLRHLLLGYCTFNIEKRSKKSPWNKIDVNGIKLCFCIQSCENTTKTFQMKYYPNRHMIDEIKQV